MKIIDSHLHYCPGSPYFDEIAVRAEHINSGEHLREQYQIYEIETGVVMGNRGLSFAEHDYPDFLHYCIGIDSHYLKHHDISDAHDMIEQHLQRDTCAGIKLYPGYSPVYISDARYEPIYELAKTYGKPVAVHMGQTAGSNAFLKYSHPLTLDEVAVTHPDVRFIMCHFGNPWLMDAAAVLEKNENVAADLSGLLEGKLVLAELLEEQKGYVEALKTWIAYAHCYDKLMFGTDWPLANYGDYIGFTKAVIPKKHWDNVFYRNAKRIYSL